MTLLEEKKMVAEWMGWGGFSHGFNRDVGSMVIQDVYWDDWNPQSDRNAWPEIWGKLSNLEWFVYKQTLVNEFRKIAEEVEGIVRFDLQECMHTASPETCWKALIKTIEK